MDNGINLVVKIDSVVATRTLVNAAMNVKMVLGQALYAEGQFIIAASTRIAPWDKRILIGSARVLAPVVSGTIVSVTLGYGGAASKYAEVQHDKYPHKRKPGRQWHYLIDPVRQREALMKTTISNRMSQLLQGGR